MSPEIIPSHPLNPCVAFLRSYIGRIDRNGLCVFDDHMDAAHTGGDGIPGDVAQLMSDLTETLRTRFEVDVLDEAPRDLNVNPTLRDMAENLEDRENAFAVLERAEAFGAVAYAGEFMRLAPYILRNIHPEDVA